MYIWGIEEHEFEECTKMTGFAQAFTNLHFKQIDCTFAKTTLQISTLKQKKLLGEELHPGLLCDR